MNTEAISIIVSAIVALLGSLGALFKVVLKYRGAKADKKEAEKKEFYLNVAYNIVIEAEKVFGDGRGAEKKQYALTKLQNEALSSKIAWDVKLASTCIEKCVALRNDYKGQNVNIEEVIKVEKEEANKNLDQAKEELKETFKDTVGQVISGVNTIKNVVNQEESKVSVIKIAED